MQNVTSLLAVVFVSAFSSLASYDQRVRKETRSALGIVLFASVISFLLSLGGSIDVFTEEQITVNYDTDASVEGALLSGFNGGVADAVAQRFSLRTEDISVSSIGFSKENMRAEKITITLFGRAALADGASVEKYAESLDLGDVEVKISFDKNE